MGECGTLSSASIECAVRRVLSSLSVVCHVISIILVIAHQGLSVGLHAQHQCLVQA